MFVRLTLEESRDDLLATISERDGDGKIVGPPRIFLVRTKEEAKKRASAVAKDLGLTSYRIMDKSRTPQEQNPPTSERVP
jgi:hypothetical protein